MTILFLLCQYSVWSIDWCGEKSNLKQFNIKQQHNKMWKNEGVWIFSQGTAASLVSGDQGTAIVLYTVIKLDQMCRGYWMYFILLYCIVVHTKFIYKIFGIWTFLLFFIYCKFTLQ